MPQGGHGDAAARKDWCRNAEWTPLAREKFFLRLSSLRDTAKYLRRKAGYLLVTQPDAALELLTLAVGESRRPGEKLAALREQARAAVYCRQEAQAAAAWQAALALADTPATQTAIALEYAAWIVAARRIDDFSAAGQGLAGLDEQLLDAVQRFLYFGTRALLAAQGNDPLRARLEAQSALTAHRRFAADPRTFPQAALEDALADDFYARLYALAGRTLAD